MGFTVELGGAADGVHCLHSSPSPRQHDRPSVPADAPPPTLSPAPLCCRGQQRSVCLEHGDRSEEAYVVGRVPGPTLQQVLKGKGNPLVLAITSFSWFVL